MSLSLRFRQYFGEERSPDPRQHHSWIGASADDFIGLGTGGMQAFISCCCVIYLQERWRSRTSTTRRHDAPHGQHAPAAADFGFVGQSWCFRRILTVSKRSSHFRVHVIAGAAAPLYAQEPAGCRLDTRCRSGRSSRRIAWRSRPAWGAARPCGQRRGEGIARNRRRPRIRGRCSISGPDRVARDLVMLISLSCSSSTRS